MQPTTLLRLFLREGRDCIISDQMLCYCGICATADLLDLIFAIPLSWMVEAVHFFEVSNFNA